MIAGLLRRMALVGALLLASAPLLARPAERPVLVFQPQGSVADPTVKQTIDERLRVEIRDIVGARLFDARPGRPADCDSEPECLVELAVEQGASLLVATRVAGSAEGYTFEARLFDDQGALVAAAERTFRGSPPSKMLRSVAVQLFDPARYVGTLRLADVPPGAQVAVDRLPLRARDLTGPIALTVGVHEVTVEAAGGPARTERVEVPFADEVSFSLKPRPAPARADAPPGGAPLWPTLASGAVAGVGFVVAGVFLLDSAFTRAWADAQASAVQHVVPAGANPHFYASEYVPDHAERLSDQRLAAQNSLRVSLASTGLALASGAVAGALFTAYLGAEGAESLPGE